MICIILVAGHGALLEREIQVGQLACMYRVCSKGLSIIHLITHLTPPPPQHPAHRKMLVVDTLI